MVEPAEEESPSVVTKLISQLSENAEVHKPISFMIAIGEGLSSLPKKCVKKILTGEFIDLPTCHQQKEK